MNKRLYLVTGKGGVGKSTYSLSLASHLSSLNKKILFVDLLTSSIDDKDTKTSNSIKIAQELNIGSLGLNLHDACLEYMAGKLKSQTIANWIIKTSFFRALINMIPGFNYLIYLGKIISMLDEDPELKIVLDAPASGHALTMLEATKNFGNIFNTGSLFEDTKKMLNFLKTQDNFRVDIISLPTQMALNEAKDLESAIKDIDQFETNIIINNIITARHDFSEGGLPDFMKKKLANEKQVIEEFSALTQKYIPHSLEQENLKIVQEIIPSISNLL